jgi:hypothetical protein
VGIFSSPGVWGTTSCTDLSKIIEDGGDDVMALGVAVEFVATMVGDMLLSRVARRDEEDGPAPTLVLPGNPIAEAGRGIGGR